MAYIHAVGIPAKVRIVNGVTLRWFASTLEDDLIFTQLPIFCSMYPQVGTILLYTTVSTHTVPLFKTRVPESSDYQHASPFQVVPGADL